jgi:hypothetical protein
MPWSVRFDYPIALADGRALHLLREAGEYVAALPEETAGLGHWQLAAELLVFVAEKKGLVMMARIAMMRALNAGKPEPKQEPRTKWVKAYRIIS